MGSPWNSLEIVKLVVSSATPILLLLLGVWVARIGKRFEATQWANQKVIEKRIATFDQAAPLLNDLYCYFMWFGNWKELTPPEVITIKRALDKIIYVNAFLFTRNFVTLYGEWSDCCFETFAGVGRDALLRTAITSGDGDRRGVAGAAWQPEWDQMFSREEARASGRQIDRAYKELVKYFSRELGIAEEDRATDRIRMLLHSIRGRTFRPRAHYS